MKIYAIRESWDYEVNDLIEFFLKKEDADRRATQLTAEKRSVYNDYEVEEVEAR